ncbi:glycosyltransferase [Actinomycetospora lutea]|uniref:glycosyltransferase family 2 protein n=1 Tax=Actinomycetospora lutea TaxID=663604 RepID=UPI002365C321|nr:glycosyltransferase [Actinomycetospora lutea]MDD7941980.1 glycosyltransferase [Actinomycetospora lutea]
MPDRASAMTLCIVISTIGRSAALERLLDSMVEQTTGDFSVGICDQSEGSAVAEIIRRYQDRLDLFTVSSSPGLSAGRNAVVRAAPTSVSHFLFPNDTSVLDPSFCERLQAKHADADIVAMSYVSDGRPRYEHPVDHAWTKFTVWSAIEAATVMSRRVLDQVGGFDEGLGSGSFGPWQSGEGTDLLLRTLSTDAVVRWDADFCVRGVAQAHGLSRVEEVRKLRVYARGKGFVVRRWSYPLHYRAGTVLKPWVDLLLGRTELGLHGVLATSLGRAEGLVGHCWGRSSESRFAPVRADG